MNARVPTPSTGFKSDATEAVRSPSAAAIFRRATDRPDAPVGKAYDYYTHEEVRTGFDFYVPGSTREVLGQWHLTRLGDLQSVWQDFTGRGVSVGVYDSGVQATHWDLAANYDASKHVVIDGQTFDGTNDTNGHGTSVAGLIAAARNGRGGVGVSYDATVTGVQIFFGAAELDATQQQATFFEGLRQANQFDVVNHSWGSPISLIARENSRSVEGTSNNMLAKALQFASETGREGLGTINMVAAGNSRIDHQSSGMATDRHAIAVSAYREADGASSFYSSRGAHVLVSAPSSDFLEIGGSGLVTTDLVGAAGYNMTIDPATPADYTDAFGGTSGATPIATGVVALMLDANEGLGWRDVKNILAASAKLPVAFETGPIMYGDRVLTFGKFQITGDQANWNGGGMHYSSNYGYGAIDAYAAVRMAEVWSLFGEAKTSANEVKVSTDNVDINMKTFGVRSSLISLETIENPVPETARISFEVAESLNVEHVDMTLHFSQYLDFYLNSALLTSGYTSLIQAQIRLISPDGTVASFFGGSDQQTETENQEFVFGFSGFRGAETKGTWTLEFQNFDFREVITLNIDGVATEINWEDFSELFVSSLKLDFFGSETSENDVHHYTEEFFDMAAIDGEQGRRTLTDDNAGDDWINAAAVARNIDLSLMEGATTRFGGRDAFTITSGSLIENAVTGDGNDRLIGNALDNKLYGMRGDDWLNGGLGDDTLYGGAGNDIFAFDTAGVSGKDRILDWSVGDRVATSKQLRGVDQNGMLTVGSNALLLLDGTARGDTAELVGQGGAVLQALGRSDGYWWYGFVSGGDTDFVDGRVSELALGQTGRSTTVATASSDALTAGGHTGHDNAFYLYNTMGDSMAGGVQLFA